MPKPKSSAKLQSSHNGISACCHNHSEPAIITKNGKENLAIMSIEVNENLIGKSNLYSLVSEGLDAIEAGNTRPLSDVISDIRAKRKQQ